jgi:hypothetical protein
MARIGHWNKDHKKSLLLSIVLILFLSSSLIGIHENQKNNLEGNSIQVVVNSIIITDSLESAKYSVQFGIKYSIFLDSFQWEEIMAINSEDAYYNKDINFLDINTWESSSFKISNIDSPKFQTTISFRLKQHFTVLEHNSFESGSVDFKLNFPNEGFVYNLWINQTIDGGYYFGGFVQITYKFIQLDST